MRIREKIREIVREEYNKIRIEESLDLAFNDYTINTYNGLRFIVKTPEKNYDLTLFPNFSDNTMVNMDFKRVDFQGYETTNDTTIKEMSMILTSCYESFILFLVINHDNEMIRRKTDVINGFSFTAAKKDNEELLGSNTSRSRLYNAFIKRRFGSVVSSVTENGAEEFVKFKTSFNLTDENELRDLILKMPYIETISSRNTEVKDFLKQS